MTLTQFDQEVTAVEAGNLEDKLKTEVIDLWEEIESKFENERKPKQR